MNSMVYVGDVVIRRKGLIKHFGYVYDQERILHTTPGKGTHLSDFREFSMGKRTFVVPQPRNNISKSHGLATHALLNPLKYDLLNKNCEHLVSGIVNGEARSHQLQGLFIICVLTFGFCMVLRK